MLYICAFHLRVANPLVMLWIMIWYRLPEKGKRLFVLVSLYSRLSGKNYPNHRELSEVNLRFSLTQNPRALSFPALAAGKVWTSILPLKQVTFHDDRNREHYINRLVKKTPCWLWYADSETRRKDIHALITWMSGNADVAV